MSEGRSGAERRQSARSEMGEIATLAAHETVRETFRLFGVDIDDQQQVNAFRADLIYARKIRQLSEKAGTVAWRVFITAIVTGAIAALWQGFRDKLH